MTFNTGTSSALDVSGGIADYPGLTGTPVVVSGSGTTTLSGTSTYAGTTTITSGTLVVSGLLGGGNYGAGITDNGSLVFSNPGNQTLSGVVSGSGTFTKAGLGTVNLSQANSFSGGTVVSQGTLIGAASTSFGSGAIVLGNGNTGTNGIVLMANTVDSTTITNAITVANLGTGLVSIGGTNTGASNANAWTGTLTLNRNVQVFNDTPHAVGRTSFIGQITGSGGITVTQGRGRVTLQNGTNNFTGPVVVDSGATLQLDVATGLNEVIPNSAAVTVNGLLNFASGGGTETIGSLAGSGTVSSVVSGTYSLVVGGSGSGTFSGVISNGSGVVGLTKSGAGTLSVSGPNSYTGGTTISSGTLQIGSGGTSGFIAGNVLNNATLAFNRSNALSFSGTISGTGGLSKQAAGLLTFAGVNSYSGLTTISAGTLALSGVGSIGTGGLNLGTSGSPGVFDLLGLTAGSYSLPSSASLSGVGTLSGSGKSLAVLGSLAPGNSAGTITLGSGFTLDLSQSGSSVFEITNPTYTAGTYDLVAGDGSVVFGGILNLAFSGGSYADGTNVLQLFANTGGRSGNFSAVNATGLAAGQSATFNPVTGFITVVPEPSTYAMALAGLACGGYSMLRRRKRA
jgi:autotransporter-associated beta strand protein